VSWGWFDVGKSTYNRDKSTYLELRRNQPFEINNAAWQSVILCKSEDCRSSIDFYTI
jgi:hypothetical protein